MSRSWRFWVSIAVGLALAAVLAAVLAAGPTPAAVQSSACPGFPERALLVTYDENLTDILDINGTKKALMLKWNFTCEGVRPATQSEGGPPCPGWSSVVYSGAPFGQPKRFSAIFPDNVSWFDSTPYAVFVTNGSDFRGPLAWLGAFGGADPRWLIAAAMDGDKR